MRLLEKMGKKALEMEDEEVGAVVEVMEAVVPEVEGVVVDSQEIPHPHPRFLLHRLLVEQLALSCISFPCSFISWRRPGHRVCILLLLCCYSPQFFFLIYP